METLTPLPPTSEERTWGMLTHFAAILGFFFPFGAIIGPLIAWSVKKHESAFVDENGKSAVNFNLTWTVVAAILWAVFIFQFLGKFIHLAIMAENGVDIDPENFPFRIIFRILMILIPLILIYLFKFVMMLIGSIQSSNGTVFHYPLTYRFIK